MVKRALDVLLGTIGLALTAPLYPFIIAAIYLESPGPVFFRQIRAGRLRTEKGPGAQPFLYERFAMWKFRTMRLNAEAKTGAVLAGQDDPRVTRIGKFLRKTRLDELPQLWNVVRGDMSLVGPRPERPELLENLALAIPYFEERMRGIKPGITGLAQISLSYTGRPPDDHEIKRYEQTLTNPLEVPESEGSLADDMRIKLLYDLAYCAATERLWTFLLTELRILIQTPLVMLRGVGR